MESLKNDKQTVKDVTSSVAEAAPQRVTTEAVPDLKTMDLPSAMMIEPPSEKWDFAIGVARGLGYQALSRIDNAVNGLVSVPFAVANAGQLAYAVARGDKESMKREGKELIHNGRDMLDGASALSLNPLSGVVLAPIYGTLTAIETGNVREGVAETVQQSFIYKGYEIAEKGAGALGQDKLQGAMERARTAVDNTLLDKRPMEVALADKANPVSPATAPAQPSAPDANLPPR